MKMGNGNELSEAESDKLLREELGFGEDDTTINDNESEEDETTEDESETSEEENTEEDEDETDETSEDETEEEDEEQKWKGKRAAKLLHQRNEERKRADKAEAELQELKKGSPEYIEKLVEKKLQEEKGIDNFFNDNSDFSPYRDEILKYAKEKNLGIEEASTIIIAKNEPNLLLDQQSRAKERSKMYNAPMRSPKDLGTKKLSYSDKEFLEKVNKGEVKL